jgi:hypothetical protein
MIKPFGTRVLVRINKRYLSEKSGKPLLDENGNHVFDQDQEAKILVSNVPGLKKGQIIYPVIRGGVPIYKNETKKYLDVIIDIEDIYAYESK